MSRIRPAHLAIGVSLVLALAGCGGTSSPSPSASGAPGASGTPTAAPTASSGGGTVVWALNYDIVSLDYPFSYDFTTPVVVNNLTEGLLRFDQDENLVPNLATDWQNPDPLTYVYTIRQGVKFWDGNEMTADDVVFSMNRHLDSKVGSYLAGMFANVDSITKTGPWEVTVKMKAPDPLWKYVPATSGGMVTEESWVKAHPDVGKANTGVMGTGPFMFDHWTAGQEIVLKRNPDYWNTARSANIDELDFKVLPETNTIITGLQTGDVNGTFALPYAQFDVVKGMSNVRLTTVASYNIESLVFNVRRAPFTDAKVRQALSYVMDRAGLVQQALRGYGAVAKGPVPPAMFTFAKDTFQTAYDGLPDYSMNLDKAKQLLAESSVPNGFKASITTDNIPEHLSDALALQEAAKALNIDFTIDKVTGEELVSRAFSSDHNYDVLSINWGSDFPDPTGNMLFSFGSDYAAGGANWAGFSDSTFDKLMADQAAATDETSRATLIMQADQELLNQAPWIFLYYPEAGVAMSNDLTGYGVTPIWYWDAIGLNLARAK
jgi:peptide/nickel transport system substrate-binding protein